MKFFKDAKNEFDERMNSLKGRRIPYYELAGRYLPDDPDDLIVDLGAGGGIFADHLKLGEKYHNLFLLDDSATQIQILKEKNYKVKQWHAPEPIPFDDNSVSFIMISHLIEHLHYSDLFSLMSEVNRVMKNDGVVVISTPLLWKVFYNDRTHIKPYNPEVVMRILCGMDSYITGENVSKDFKVLKLVFRYQRQLFTEKKVTSGTFWAADLFLFDLIIKGIRKILNIIGIYKYEMNGYTLILQKMTGNEQT